MPDITSRQHWVVRAFRAAAHNETDAALLDGWHLLHDAASAGLAIRTVALCGAPVAARDAALLDQVARQSDVFTVSSAVMDALSPVRTPSGVVALAARRPASLSELLSPAPALVLVAADIQDPGNAGAIVRSAEAGGATGVLFVGQSADPWSWKALRAAMGSTFRLPVLRSRDWSPLAAALRERGLKLVASVPRRGTPLPQVDLTRPVAILVGGEGHGLDQEALGGTDEQLSIPMQPPVESLNVAAACAVIVYEARRQREA